MGPTPAGWPSPESTCAPREAQTLRPKGTAPGAAGDPPTPLPVRPQPLACSRDAWHVHPPRTKTAAHLQAAVATSPFINKNVWLSVCATAQRPPETRAGDLTKPRAACPRHSHQERPPGSPSRTQTAPQGPGTAGRAAEPRGRGMPWPGSAGTDTSPCRSGSSALSARTGPHTCVLSSVRDESAHRLRVALLLSPVAHG